MYKNIQHVIDVVKQAARDELVSRFTRVESQQKMDGSLITEADLAMQQRMQAELQSLSSETVLLSEEMTTAEQEAVLNADRPVWCLDPLDGTSNYAAGIPYFAVSLSLIHQQQVVMGLVYDPVRDECFYADEQTAGHLNEKPLQLNNGITHLDQAMAVIDLKRLDQSLAAKLATEQPFASQRNFGASALDWCWLAAQRGHIYLHGRQNIWDYSAGQYIFEKAGGYSCTLDGAPIFCQQLVGRSVLASVNEPLFEQWKNWLNVR